MNAAARDQHGEPDLQEEREARMRRLLERARRGEEPLAYDGRAPLLLRDARGTVLWTGDDIVEGLRKFRALGGATLSRDGVLLAFLGEPNRHEKLVRLLLHAERREAEARAEARGTEATKAVTP